MVTRKDLARELGLSEPKLRRLARKLNINANHTVITGHGVAADTECGRVLSDRAFTAEQAQLLRAALGDL